ncbi:MAG: LOG family protein [Acidobacteria bacterium]|nr:MAG: LOG family protein [Acidobacteriota bacterium]
MSERTPDPHGERATDNPDSIDLCRIIDQSVAQLWETVESLERLQPRNLQRFRVSVFGSSRVPPESPLFNDVKEMTRRLSAAGCDLVTGGGAGLMQAANEGATNGQLSTPASGDLPIRLIEGHTKAPFVEKVYRHRTFFTRLHHFVRLSSAFIVLPGGIGTTLEAMMIWQLLQVEHLPSTPFLLYGDHWNGLLQWVEETMVDNHYADRRDLSLPTVVTTVDEVVEVILMDFEHFQANNPAGTGNSVR